MPEFNEEFLNFLRNTPAVLADFMKVAKKFVEVHGEVPPGGAPPETSGPRRWEEGEAHELTTEGLSQADLDALIEASAEAAVIEKAITYLKGVVAGIMFKGV